MVSRVCQWGLKPIVFVGFLGCVGMERSNGDVDEENIGI